MSFSITYALAELSPLLARWLGGENGEKMAKQAVNIAQSITGEKEVSKVIGSLKGILSFW